MRLAIAGRQLPHPTSPVSPLLTISVGVATATREWRSSPEELIAAADQALYGAKRSGRNRVNVAQLEAVPYTSPKPTSGPLGSTSGLPIIRAIAEYLPESDIPTTSPWDGFVLPARERTSRTIRTEQRNAHHLARAIFDRGRALVSVEVRLS